MSALTLKCCVDSGEAANTNFNVFVEIELTTFCTVGEHADNYTTKVVCIQADYAKHMFKLLKENPQAFHATPFLYYPFFKSRHLNKREKNVVLKYYINENFTYYKNDDFELLC